ncbi:MAG TPA: bile acid:sodium symporter family protein [Puia sp.]|nr:bile acid:sodium symporter family protein [Puia sp.]
MKKLPAFRIALLLAAILFVLVLGFAFSGHLASAGPFAIAGFLALALGCRGYELTRGLTYTVVIFAAVTTALYYPQYFQVWGGFKLATLITPLIQVIMFGMGTSMGLKDFAGVIKTPKGVVIGVCSHFIIMPLIGFTLAQLSGLPPEIAAGIILIGCSPNGLASNVISYLAKANLALSITITAVSTLLAPFVTPFLMKLLAGAFVHIDAMGMMWDIIKMVIIPIGGGIIFNRLFGGTTGHGEVDAPAKGRRKAAWLDKAMPLVSMAGIACIIVIITAAGRNSLLTIGPLLVVFVLLHNLSGYALGYWTGRLFRMDERDCRTMAIEVGMQNGGLASGLAKEMGKMATVGLAPAIFGPLMNVTGSILASWWHRKPPKDPSPGKEAPAGTVAPMRPA